MSSSTSTPSSSALPSRAASPTLLVPSRSLDLTSYFDDIDGLPTSPKSKSRKSLPRQRAPAKRPARRPLVTRSPPSEEADAWEQQAWQTLVTRQRTEEEKVRKAILGRKDVAPSELQKWLDSNDTVSLPEPSLGVRIRQQDL